MASHQEIIRRIIGEMSEAIAGREGTQPKKLSELLEELRTSMGALSRVEIDAEMKNVNLELLFACLDTDNLDQLQTTCDILKNLMYILDPFECLNKYHQAMVEGLSHPHAQVRQLVIAQLKRCLEAGEGKGSSVLKTEYEDLLVGTMKEMGSDDLGAAKYSGGFLISLACEKPGAEFLLGPNSRGLLTFKSILNGPDTSESIKFRIYDTLVNISLTSAENLAAVEGNLGFASQLGELLEGTDPLSQMNALEILSAFLATESGASLLAEKGIYEKVEKLAHGWESNPMSGLLLPGILKFIGKVGVRQMPKESLQALVYSAIIDSKDDVALVTVGVEALAFIGSSSEGKAVLNAKPEMKRCLMRIKHCLKDEQNDFRSRILDGLAILFASENGQNVKLSGWFEEIFPNISVLFSLVQQPFGELRLAALHFLGSISSLEWAQAHYLRIPGVIEFLTDRHAEPTKECSLAKFHIVASIVECPTTPKFLSADDLATLKVHVKQGPYYAPVEATVAVGEAS